MSGEETLAFDFESYLEGGAPRMFHCVGAPKLDMWRVVVKRVKSGRYFMSISGDVTGHPGHADGSRIETSAIVWMDRKMTWCRSINRLYMLGDREITLDGF